MARSWTEFLGDAEGPYETVEAQRGFVGRLRDSLSKSRRALTEQLAVAVFDPTDDASWERLEEALLQGDVGVAAAAELIRRLEGPQELRDPSDALPAQIAAKVRPPPQPRPPPHPPPAHPRPPGN